MPHCTRVLVCCTSASERCARFCTRVSQAANPASQHFTVHCSPTLGRRYPWFIYVFGGAGLFVFITASVGILSADCAGCGVTCFLGLYHALMVLLLLIQIAVVCFYFFDKSWENELPHDRTGAQLGLFAKQSNTAPRQLRNDSHTRQPQFPCAPAKRARTASAPS